MQDDKGGDMTSTETDDESAETVSLTTESTDDQPEAATASLSKSNSIQWTASDAVEHERSKAWYILATLITAGVIGLAIWMNQWSLAILVFIILIAIFVVVGKPSREIHYELSSDGLSVDGRLYPISDFRAFGVRHDGALWQLVLIPVKRFALSVTTFINEDQGEQIVDFLGAVLPMEEVQQDFVDTISKRLKL